MPSREEIAIALREAQSTINTLVIHTGNYPSKSQPFSDLAAQVENMRCENCNSKDELLKGMAEVLEKLSRLGNEPYLGNSVGNVMAQDALQKYREHEATNAKT